MKKVDEAAHVWSQRVIFFCNVRCNRELIYLGIRFVNKKKFE